MNNLANQLGCHPHLGLFVSFFPVILQKSLLTDRDIPAWYSNLSYECGSDWPAAWLYCSRLHLFLCDGVAWRNCENIHNVVELA